MGRSSGFSPMAIAVSIRHVPIMVYKRIDNMGFFWGLCSPLGAYVDVILFPMVDMIPFPQAKTRPIRPGFLAPILESPRVSFALSRRERWCMPTSGDGAPPRVR